MKFIYTYYPRDTNRSSTDNIHDTRNAVGEQQREHSLVLIHVILCLLEEEDLISESTRLARTAVTEL